MKIQQRLQGTTRTVQIFFVMDSSDHQTQNQLWEHSGGLSLNGVQQHGFTCSAIRISGFPCSCSFRAQNPTRTEIKLRNSRRSSVGKCLPVSYPLSKAANFCSFSRLYGAVFVVVVVRLKPHTVPSPRSGTKIPSCATRAGFCCRRCRQKQSESLARTLEAQWFLWPLTPWRTKK